MCRIWDSHEKIRIRDEKSTDPGSETLVGRVADPVHLRPDPAPDLANRYFETGSRILLALKETIQTSKFFSHQTYFLRYLNDNFYLKNWKNSLENV